MASPPLPNLWLGRGERAYPLRWLELKRKFLLGIFAFSPLCSQRRVCVFSGHSNIEYLNLTTDWFDSNLRKNDTRKELDLCYKDFLGAQRAPRACIAERRPRLLTQLLEGEEERAQQRCRSSPASGGGLARLRARRAPLVPGRGGEEPSCPGEWARTCFGEQCWGSAELTGNTAASAWGHCGRQSDRLLSAEWNTTLKHEGDAFQSRAPGAVFLPALGRRSPRPRSSPWPQRRLRGLSEGRGLGCGVGRAAAVPRDSAALGRCVPRNERRGRCHRWSPAGLCGSLGRASWGGQRRVPAAMLYIATVATCGPAALPRSGGAWGEPGAGLEVNPWSGLGDAWGSSLGAGLCPRAAAESWSPRCRELRWAAPSRPRE